MAEGDLITGNWQVELRGVLFAADCHDGEPLIVTRWLDGFGVPSGRTNLVPRPLAHGAFPGPQYMDTRTMTLGVMAAADTWDDLQSAMLALGTAYAPVLDTDPDYVVPLVFTLDDPDVAYRVVGIPTRAAWGYDDAILYDEPGLPRFVRGALCEFVATDPRIYWNTVQSATATLGELSGGLDLPHAFPHAFGTAESGAAICENVGNIATFPTITVTAGPSGASGVTLSNETTGQEWSINLTLSAGDTLTVDMGARTALLNGTADRAPFVNRPDSTWFGLAPGTNAVRLIATGTDTTALVEWRSAGLF